MKKMCVAIAMVLVLFVGNVYAFENCREDCENYLVGFGAIFQSVQVCEFSFPGGEHAALYGKHCMTKYNIKDAELERITNIGANNFNERVSREGKKEACTFMLRKFYGVIKY